MGFDLIFFLVTVYFFFLPFPVAATLLDFFAAFGGLPRPRLAGGAAPFDSASTGAATSSLGSSAFFLGDSAAGLLSPACKREEKRKSNFRKKNYFQEKIKDPTFKSLSSNQESCLPFSHRFLRTLFS